MELAFDRASGKPFIQADFAAVFRDASECCPTRGKNGEKMKTGVAKTSGAKMTSGEKTTAGKTTKVLLRASPNH